ncbi:ABC transporter substrate-binding protein [Bauldia sp.]|uniref:ABC transporter substrate-binding protein n=1 Tax=Bauldia sp. TaxID=2575872 RepID=UPI003BAA95E6
MTDLRWTYAVTGVVLLATALAAPAALAAEGKLTVWGDTLRVQSYKVYAEQNDGVELDIVTVAPEEMVTKLQLALRAGSGVPDLVFISDAPNSAMLATRRADYLMNLDGLVDEALLGDFYPNANAPCIVNEDLVCLRNDLAHNLIWYDKPQMEAFGYAVPTTWEEFIVLSADLAENHPGYFLGSSTDPYGVYAMIMSSGCDMATPVAGRDNTLLVDLSNDACLRAADMIDTMNANGTLIKSGPFDPEFVQTAQDGKLLLYVGPTWFGEFILKPSYQIPAGEIAAAIPPRWSEDDKPLTWSFGGGAFGIWKDTDNLDAALDMLVWLTTSEANQKDAVTFPPYAPVTVLWGEKLIDDAYYADDQVFAAMEEAATYADPRNNARRFDMPSVIGKIVSPAVASGRTLRETLPALEQEIVNTARVAGYEVVNE